jgi:hypothetical protein
MPAARRGQTARNAGGSCKPSMLDVTRLGSQERYVDLGKAPQAEPRHLSRLTRSLRKREKIFNSYASQTGMRSLWQYWPSSTSARRETSESISGIEFDPDNFCRTGLKERDIGGLASVPSLHTDRALRPTGFAVAFGNFSDAWWIPTFVSTLLRRFGANVRDVVAAHRSIGFHPGREQPPDRAQYRPCLSRSFLSDPL